MKRISSTEEASPNSKIPRSVNIQLKGYYSYRKGEREEMQDCHVLIDDFKGSVKDLPAGVTSLAYYAIFDGHGGNRAALFAAEHLHRNIAGRFPKGDLPTMEKELKRCFIEAYKRTDDSFLSEATKVKPVWKDGTTVTAVLAVNNVLYITNLGDSKAILCRYKPEEKKSVGLTLTRDHNPTIFEERMRIEKAGGHVRDGRVLGQLEVSRSLGDGPYKNHGISSVPDIKRCTLTEHDRYIIVACDGLWKAFTVPEVIQFVDTVLQDKKLAELPDDPSNIKSLDEHRWETVCSRLAAEAVRRKSGDNVTIVAVAIASDNGANPNIVVGDQNTKATVSSNDVCSSSLEIGKGGSGESGDL